MKQLIILLVPLLIGTVWSAFADEGPYGPYDFTFEFDMPHDLNFWEKSNDNWSELISHDKTFNGTQFTHYDFWINSTRCDEWNTTPGFAEVSIAEYHGMNGDVSQSSLEEQIKNALMSVSSGSVPLVGTRTIDEHPGAVGSLSLPKFQFFLAIYPLDLMPSNNTTTVCISSTYPWDKGTRMLLDTIHVVRRNSTLA